MQTYDDIMIALGKKNVLVRESVNRTLETLSVLEFVSQGGD